MADVRRMQLGQVVDFVIAYNDRQAQAEKQSEAQPRPMPKAKGEKAPRQLGTRDAPKRYRLATGKEAMEYFKR